MDNCLPMQETINFFTMGKIRITQIRSAIDRPERQKKTLQALGLKKLHATVEHEATPQILGMVRKVQHLVSVQPINEEK
ncbi:large subunit ribosomal protein L30 [Thermoflavifilum thermophilum]|uniref:Large ribosomal subunit protein uL30 n=2 Tax=Thermoflavifilum thermophilum TaxID=1393122 RepID=A0A1I7N303_9BACT|nr:large subunit ribosomal protein L30 [Thermoflavifilum thermophilum]